MMYGIRTFCKSRQQGIIYSPSFITPYHSSITMQASDCGVVFKESELVSWGQLIFYTIWHKLWLYFTFSCHANTPYNGYSDNGWYDNNVIHKPILCCIASLAVWGYKISFWLPIFHRNRCHFDEFFMWDDTNCQVTFPWQTMAQVETLSTSQYTHLF